MKKVFGAAHFKQQLGDGRVRLGNYRSGLFFSEKYAAGESNIAGCEITVNYWAYNGKNHLYMGESTSFQPTMLIVRWYAIAFCQTFES